MKRLFIVFGVFLLSPFCAFCESAPVSPSTPVPSTPVVATYLPATATFTPVPPTLTPTAASAEIGSIAFVSDRDGNQEIYTIFPDGSNLRRLTNNPAGDYHPSWSADGQQIAFTSERDGYTAIYVMNADGSNLRYLTQGWKPFWSPDGQWIAFQVVSASDVSIGSDLHLIQPDGANEHAIYIIQMFGESFSLFGWRDDLQAVMISAGGVHQGVMVSSECWIAVDGSHLYGGDCAPPCTFDSDTGISNCPPESILDRTRLIDQSRSSDGLAAVLADDSSGNYEIYVTDALGDYHLNISNHPAQDIEPAWMPDANAAQPAPTAQIPPTPPATQVPLPTPTNPVSLWVESSDYYIVTINGAILITQGPWIWDWGDGTVTEGWFPQTHTYAECGTYFITVYTPDYQYFNTLSVDVCGQG